MKAKKNRGFTLVEVIVVLVIVAILAAVAIPTLLGFVREARRTEYLEEGRAVLTGAETQVLQLYGRDALSDETLGAEDSRRHIVELVGTQGDLQIIRLDEAGGRVGYFEYAVDGVVVVYDASLSKMYIKGEQTPPPAPTLEEQAEKLRLAFESETIMKTVRDYFDSKGSGLNTIDSEGPNIAKTLNGLFAQAGIDLSDTSYRVYQNPGIGGYTLNVADRKLTGELADAGASVTIVQYVYSAGWSAVTSRSKGPATAALKSVDGVGVPYLVINADQLTPLA